MAKQDGTYYEDIDLTGNTVSKGAVEDIGFEVWLQGGSGTATLTILGTMDLGAGTADAVDLTTALCGVASFVDPGGGSGSLVQIIDNAGKLRGMIKIWRKIVLATGAVHDGDYEVKPAVTWHARG